MPSEFYPYFLKTGMGNNETKRTKWGGGWGKVDERA